MSGEEFAYKIKGAYDKVENTSAYDMLYIQPARLKSIRGFREYIFDLDTTQIEKIKQSPILLLDPIKSLQNIKKF